MAQMMETEQHSQADSVMAALRGGGEFCSGHSCCKLKRICSHVPWKRQKPSHAVLFNFSKLRQGTKEITFETG